MKFNFHLINMSVSDLISVSIIPLIKQDGKQITGIELDKYNLGTSKNNIPSQTTCVPSSNPCGTSVCGSAANGTCGQVSCPPGCGTGFNCVTGNCQAQIITGNFRYVRAGATGANNGSDWINAYTTLPTTLLRNYTYYIADGTYGNYIFDDAVSGTQYITIKKAIENDHGTSTGWSSNYGDEQAVFENLIFSSSYWIFDGSNRTDIDSGHGFKIQPTVSANKCIRLNNVLQNITFRYIEIEYLGATGTRDDGIYGTNVNNFILQYSYLHDIATAHILVHGTNNLIEYNYLARSFSTNSIHSDGIQCFSSIIKNMTIRYNIFEDISGTASISVAWGTDGLYIYGNIFRQSNDYDGEGTGTGQIVDISQSGETGVSNTHIYNNNFINIKKGINSGIRLYLNSSETNYVYNNLWDNSIQASLSGMTDHNYNSFYNTPIAWGTTLNNEEDILADDPLVDRINSNYNLKNPLGGLILYFPYNVDYDGNVRGADGNWDRGAYEFY